MNTSIWKYPLDVVPHQLVYMPISAKIVHLGQQNDYPVLWAEVDVESSVVPHVFSIVSTGERYTSIGARYVGTVVLKDWYVAHVFDGSLQIEGRKSPDMYELQKELREREDDQAA